MTITDEAIMNIDAAFDEEGVRDAREFVNEYEFRVGVLSTPIRIRISRRIPKGDFVFEQSHFIKTPAQYTAYAASEPFAADLAKAVNDAVLSITTFYDSATKRGHKPAEDWLVRNEYF
jgi:hypothetical protein